MNNQGNELTKGIISQVTPKSISWGLHSPYSPIFSNNTCTYLLCCPTVTSKFKHLKINLTSSLWNKLLFCHPYFYSWYQYPINQASSKSSSHPGLLPAFTLYMKSASESSHLLFFETCLFFAHPHCHHPNFSHPILKSYSCWISQSLPCLVYIHNCQILAKSMTFVSPGLFAKAISSF